MADCKYGYGHCNSCGWCSSDKARLPPEDKCWPKPVEHVPGDRPGPSPWVPPGPWDHPDSVNRGTNLYQKYAELTNRVRGLDCKVDSIFGKSMSFLKKLEATAVDEGAYYSDKEIKVDNFYSTDDASSYTLIRFKDKDCKGIPIRMELRLAANNATNAQITEDPFAASQVEFADKLVPAIPLTGNGWFGNVIYNCAPVPSEKEETLYTLGFSKSGRMRVFPNSQSVDDLQRSNIVNSMGVYGVVCSGKAVASPSQYANVPHKDDQVSRIFIGQNYDTKETFIICVSDYENNGMLTKTGGEILASYGCDIGAEVCQGDTCIALDKGSVISVPHETNITPTYAYWYITKKCQYRRQSTFNLASLTQRYGALYWRTILNKKAIDDIQSKLDDIDENFDEIEVRLSDLEARVTQTESDNADLKADLQKEIQDRIDAIEDLQNQINALDPSDIRDALAALTTRVGNTEIRLDSLDSWRVTVDANLQTLKDDVNTHYAELLALKGVVSGLADDVGSLRTQVEDLDTAFLNVLDAFKSIQEGFTEIKTQWSQIQIDFQNLTDLVNTFETRIKALEDAENNVNLFLSTQDLGIGYKTTWTAIDAAIQYNSFGVISTSLVEGQTDGWPSGLFGYNQPFVTCLCAYNRTSNNTSDAGRQKWYLAVGRNQKVFLRVMYTNNSGSTWTDTNWFELSGGGSFDPSAIEARLDAIEAEQVVQDNNISEINSEQIEQNERLESIESEQTVQNTAISNIESTQILHSNRLNAVEEEQVTQNTNITENRSSITSINNFISKGSQFESNDNVFNREGVPTNAYVNIRFNRIGNMIICEPRVYDPDVELAYTGTNSAQIDLSEFISNTLPSQQGSIAQIGGGDASPVIWVLRYILAGNNLTITASRRNGYTDPVAPGLTGESFVLFVPKEN